MKAEETVMTLDQYNMFALDFHQVNNIMELYTKCEFTNRYEQAKLARQAEISFKAGERQGMTDKIGVLNAEYRAGKQAMIREVVEWIDKQMTSLTYDTFAKKVAYRNYQIDDPIWQAQLQKWGIPKPKPNSAVGAASDG